MNASLNTDRLGAIAVLAVFAGLFWLERRRPLRRSAPEAGVEPEPDHRRVIRNAAMAAVTGVVLQLGERPVSGPLTRLVEQRRIGLLPALGLPPLAEKLAGVILLDYTLYVWHILLHRVPWLWRSHQVHHTDLVLDSTTALRFHWLEFLASVPWRAGQIVLLGIEPGTLRLWQKLTLAEVLFHHSNVRLPVHMEALISQLVVTPRMHGIHHSVRTEERDSNFSSGLSVWDVLHGTLKKDVPQQAITIGIAAYRDPKFLHLGDLLMQPFRQPPTGSAATRAVS